MFAYSAWIDSSELLYRLNPQGKELCFPALGHWGCLPPPLTWGRLWPSLTLTSSSIRQPQPDFLSAFFWVPSYCVELLILIWFSYLVPLACVEIKVCSTAAPICFILERRLRIKKNFSSFYIETFKNIFPIPRLLQQLWKGCASCSVEMEECVFVLSSANLWAWWRHCLSG